MVQESEPLTEPTAITHDEADERFERAKRKAYRGDIGKREAWEIHPGDVVFDNTSGDFPRNITLKVKEVDAPGKRMYVDGGDKYGVKWVPAGNLRSISDVGMEAYGTTKDSAAAHDIKVGLEELSKRPS